MGALGVSLDDAIALASRMASNPADSVSLSGQLVETLCALPPRAGELLSRPKFDRASLWTLGCSFENVPLSGQPPPQVIRCQHDVWVRGVQIQVYPLVLPMVTTPASLASVQQIISLLRGLRLSVGTNGRGFVRSNWRLDARQGFISRGTGEILAPAALISGDGCWQAAKDWQLQKDQTIEVRIESMFDEYGIDPPTDPLVLRWVTVCFWCEELDQPSVQ